MQSLRHYFMRFLKKPLRKPSMKVSEAEKSLVVAIRAELKMWSERLRWMKKKKMILDYEEPKLEYDENEGAPFISGKYVPIYPVESIRMNFSIK